MTDNKKIAEQVLAAVGGAANLKDATHCMTRLRLYLKDDSLPKDDEVKKISGVLGVVRGGQQYQIVIGTNVPKVYEELCKLAGISASAAVKDDAAAVQDAAIIKRKLTPKQVGKNIMGYLAGCMTPMIPVLLAGGLFRAVNSIFGPDLLGLYTLESNLYILFDFLYDAAFYFMPILVGYNAAKQLGVNGMLGSFIGSVLMVPDFAAFATNGQTFTVFGIPATVTNYAQTVLPVMLSVPLFCLIYKLVKKFMPDLLTSVFTPFFSLIISMPFILCLLAPLGTIVGNAISGGLAWFGMTTGWFGVAVIAALWEFLVMSGMHLALMMPMMADFFETGIISGPMNAGNFATWASGGTILMEAHKQLEELTLDRETLAYKKLVATKFADLVYEGKWFCPLREALQAFVEKTQETVTGQVKMRLYKGNIIKAGTTSPYSLYSESLASFTTGELYDHKDATGFINLFGLSMKVRAMMNEKNKNNDK